MNRIPSLFPFLSIPLIPSIPSNAPPPFLSLPVPLNLQSPIRNLQSPSPPRAFQKIAQTTLIPFSTRTLPPFLAPSKCSKKLEFQPPPFLYMAPISPSPQTAHFRPNFIIPSLLRPPKRLKSRHFVGIVFPLLPQSSQNRPRTRAHAPFRPSSFQHAPSTTSESHLRPPTIRPSAGRGRRRTANPRSRQNLPPSDCSRLDETSSGQPCVPAGRRYFVYGFAPRTQPHPGLRRSMRSIWVAKENVYP
jgi:hypothetical protein